MGADVKEVVKMSQSKETLRQLIAQWNANRLDLFEISDPNEEGEFHGVMRFYFQEAGAKVATKCIRVASSATAKAVIETLVEKFRPDMRMLSIPQYALYEIHENGEERRLEDQERPLLVQLNWHSDDREGRFLLKRIDEQVRYNFAMNKVVDVPFSDNFKRKLSKREKKQLKKLQEKTKAEASSVAEKLYTELPETSFTRSISNPEAVMRRRRQQKLEKKLAQFRSRDGGPDTGGTLKIYGESLCRDVPYKTLLLSVNDTAAYVVKEMLAKYALTNHDPLSYCLVQVCEGEGEYILDDDESPLSILMNQPSNRGSIMFHVRRRPPDFHPRKRKKKPGRRADEEIGSGYRGSYDGQMEPLLIELLPDGSETGRRIALESDVTEVGSEWGGLTLAGLRPRHCVVASTEGIVTVTPSSRDADIYVNGQRIYETTLLQHGTIIRFGRTHYFRFAQRGGPNAGRPFSEREVIESSPLAGMGPGGGVSNVPGGSVTQSPPMSPSHDDVPRTVRPDSILPATLELPEAGEEGFLTSTTINVSPTTLQFKLAPTYALYLAARYRATTHFRPEANPHERAHLLSTFLLRVSHILMQTIQERNSDANSLAFWMANSSELLHFLKSDRQIGAFSLEAQDVLAEVVQLAFRHLVTCIQAELSNLIGHFLLERDDDDDNATTPMLGVLGSGMTLLRRCRVNAALTIQMFSQLFHFINMAVFNKLIGMDGRNYCSRVWGNRLRRRLNKIETWAEKQGLELAADCHLVRVVQASHLLQAPKNTPEEMATAASNCFKLNSLQLRTLLMKYQYEADEIPISPEILDNVVRVAESTVDEVVRTDGRHVRVEEEPLLGLVFLLPEDGYSCDIIRGVPSGLVEFLSPLASLCRLTANPSAAGYWTIFFQDPMRSPSAMSGRSFAAAFNNVSGHSAHVPAPPGSIVSGSHLNMNNNHLTMSMSNMSMASSMGPPGNHSGMNNHSHSVISANSVNSSYPHPNHRPNELEIQTIKLEKLGSGLGLSIVAAKGVGQTSLGIYIKSVVKGGSAEKDGRLAKGDQLLSVDGQSLIGITQEQAADFLIGTGPIVTLEVAKQAAVYQGLATMLSHPSPVQGRAGFNGSRGLSERDLPSQVLREQNRDTDGHHGRSLGHGHPLHQPRIHSSKSVPSLNSDNSSSMAPTTIVQPIIRSPGHSINSGHHGHDPQNGPRYPPNYPSMTMQAPAKPPMMGNHHLTNSSSNMDMQMQHPGAVRSRSIQSLADPPHRPDIGNKQPSTPSLHLHQPEDSERFYQNVGYYPPPPAPPSNPANMPVRTYIPYSSSAGNISSSAFRSPGGHPSHNQHVVSSGYPGPRHPPNLNNSMPGNLNWPRPPQTQNPNINRDLLRQEAKMLEMHEELKRREERATLMMAKAQQNHPQQQQQQQRYNPQQQQQQNRFYPGQPGQRPMSSGAPPTAPKPYRPEISAEAPPGRPPLPDEYKQQQFSASMTEIPRGAFSYNNGGIPKNPNVGTNPWDREAAKEIEAVRRKEAAKYWRDQQIRELELIPNRNGPQEEQLRALILEREFQRRAEEIRREDENGEDEEEEEEDERKQMVRRVQEDLERTRITTNGNKLLDPMGEERARKIEEMRKKQLELEAAQAAEERLVREATKRREEELKRQNQMMQQHQQHLQQQLHLQQQQHQQQQQQQQHQQQHLHQPPQTLSYQSPYRSSFPPKLGSPGESSENHMLSPTSAMAPPLPKSPPPAIYRNHQNHHQSAPSPQKSPVTPPESSPRPKSDKKTVSFNETVATKEPSSPEETEKVREDPNRFLSEATALLASPRSPDGQSPGTGNTPGVIGAQEVYRDPRWRRMAEQQQKQQAANAPKPEKLTFKEKMKMFAMEAGDDTPKDKVKSSKAQREIETPVTPVSGK